MPEYAVYQVKGNINSIQSAPDLDALIDYLAMQPNVDQRLMGEVEILNQSAQSWSIFKGDDLLFNIVKTADDPVQKPLSKWFWYKSYLYKNSDSCINLEHITHIEFVTLEKILHAFVKTASGQIVIDGDDAYKFRAYLNLYQQQN